MEVIIALKNLATRKELTPEAVGVLTKNIMKTGISGVVTPVVHKTREQLGLDMYKVKADDIVARLAPPAS